MAHIGDERTGKRIASFRKLRGLTQRGLALKAAVSYSTLTKIESGHSMAQPSVVAAVARALSVNVTQLTGQPYLTELRALKLEQFVEQLRIALDSYDLPPTEDLIPRPLSEIRAEVMIRCEELRAAHLGQVAAVLPGLLDELTIVVTADDTDSDAWGTLFMAYDCVRFVASAWGFPDLAMTAVDRMGWTASRSDDPLAEAVRCYQRSLEHMRSGHYRHAVALSAKALDASEGAPPSVERTAVEGQAHLGAAINAALVGDGDGSDGHLAIADEAAAKVGEVPAVFWLSFGPANVGVHRVAALVERNAFDQAVAAAERLVLPDSWHASRKGAHFVDVARANAWLGRYDAALEALGTARAVAPQRTRFNPLTRDTVEHLVDMRRRLPEPLANYARWTGYI